MERVGISRNWVSTYFLTFMVSLGIVTAPLGVSPSCHVTKGFKNIYLLQVLVAVCRIFISAHWLVSSWHVEKEMATHCSILAWIIPWTEEPGGQRSMGSQRVRHSE